MNFILSIIMIKKNTTKPIKNIFTIEITDYFTT